MTKLIYPPDWTVFDSAEDVAHFAVNQILDIAQQSIDLAGAFHLVTAGGTTPLQVYRQLLTHDSDTNIDWSKWHIYMGDERCLPADDPERNSLALQQAWLNKSSIPLKNQHFMPAEFGAKEAVNQYEKVVKGVVFDCVLLGMGEDGHTASLFPGHQHTEEQYQLVQTEYHSPKPPAERVTLSSACLSNSQNVIKLITGEGKRAAMQLWLEGKALPIKKVQGQITLTLISKESLPT